MLTSVRHYNCRPDIGKLMRIYHKGGSGTEEVNMQMFHSRPGFATSVCGVCGHTGQRSKMVDYKPSRRPPNSIYPIT